MPNSTANVALTPADLDTLREVIDYQIMIAKEWLDIADPTMGDPASDLRELQEWKEKLQAREVTPNDVKGIRGWVQTHLDEFVSEWVGDYPEDESYREIKVRCEALLDALI